MEKLFVPGPDGKPVFIGKEDPNQKPVERGEGSKIECPVCKGIFDYLLGDDTPDGGVRGCEKCWKPSQKGGNNGNEGTNETIFD